jgi:hypothetical protein
MREVVPAFRVKMVRFSGGERFPVLLDRAGMPLGEPVPYLWRRRSEGRAVNTLESNAQALAMVHDFLLANDIDFRLRVPEGLRKRTFSAYARSATAGARLRTEDEEYSRQHLGKGPDFLFLDAGKSGLTIDRSGFLGLIRVVQSGNIGGGSRHRYRQPVSRRGSALALPRTASHEAGRSAPSMPRLDHRPSGILENNREEHPLPKAERSFCRSRLPIRQRVPAWQFTSTQARQETAAR